MKGYIFEYYKYVRYLGKSMKPIREALNYDEAEKSWLTFGDYDRLKINVVKSFSRYRDLSALARSWVGNRQSILLYELEEEPAFTYCRKENEYGFQGKTGELDVHLFFALTEFDFHSTLHADLFLAAHTTFSKNPNAEKRPDYQEAMARIKGKAILQITSKKPVGNLEDLKKYGIDKIMHTSGEYDIAVDLTAEKAYNYFEKEGVFDHDKDTYQDLFLQTRLTLGEEIDLPDGTASPRKAELLTEPAEAKKKATAISEEELKNVDKLYINMLGSYILNKNKSPFCCGPLYKNQEFLY